MPLLHGVEHLRQRQEERGGGQQPQRVSRRRGIDDHVVVVVQRSEPLNLEQAEQLVDAGQRQLEEAVDIAAIENRAAQQDGAERRAPLGDPARQRAIGVELACAQRAAADRHADRVGAKPATEHIAERVGRIGRNHEDAPPLLAGRTACAAAQVVLPLPPLPPKKTDRHAPVGWRHIYRISRKTG